MFQVVGVVGVGRLVVGSGDPMVGSVNKRQNRQKGTCNMPWMLIAATPYGMQNREGVLCLCRVFREFFGGQNLQDILRQAVPFRRRVMVY